MSETPKQAATTRLYDIESEGMQQTIPVAIVLPPDFDGSQKLPLLIWLHGGGGDRNQLLDMLPAWQALWDAGVIPPMVMVTFSSGGGSWYAGEGWEHFVVDELPRWASSELNTRLDREGTVLTGGSMGGYGTLKIAFKYPQRFIAIAALEPAIEPSFERMPDHKRNTWFRTEAIETMIWGSPVDEKAWIADNPATVARDHAERIRDSGMEIYLEAGDRDYINLHDGAEFMHRVLWDRDIRHEYHLVRGADHVGLSLDRRLRESFQFLAAALAGTLEEPIDLPLTEGEKAYLEVIRTGVIADGDFTDNVEDPTKDPVRAPTVHRHLWDMWRVNAADDPEMQRAYAKLPPTT